MVIQLYKNAFNGLSKEIWSLAFVIFINRAGGMVMPFMTIFAVQQLHFTIVNASMVITCFGLGAVLGGLTGGRMAEKVGFYKVQLFSLFTSGLLFILLGYQHILFPVMATVFLLSFCSGTINPANSLAIGHYSSSDNRVRSFSLRTLAINIGWAIGGGMGGILASFNYHLLFWVDGGTSLLAGMFLIHLFSDNNIPVNSQHNKTMETVSL